MIRRAGVALLGLLWATAALAQSFEGQLPAGYVWGNPTTSPGIAVPASLQAMLAAQSLGNSCNVFPVPLSCGGTGSGLPSPALFDAIAGWNGVQLGILRRVAPGQYVFLSLPSPLNGVLFNLNGGFGTSGGFGVDANHTRALGSAPTLSSCGTAPSVSGSDLAGVVTMGTGNPTGCVITFANAYASAPYCTVTWQTNIASMQYTVTKTAITLVQTATSSNLVNYRCDGQSGG